MPGGWRTHFWKGLFTSYLEPSRNGSEEGILVHWATITKYHKLGALNNRNLLFRGLGDSKSELKEKAGFVPSEGYEQNSVPCLSLSLWWFSGHLWQPWPIDPPTQSLLSYSRGSVLYTGPSLCPNSLLL